MREGRRRVEHPGQPPSITVIRRVRPYCVAAGETLPAPRPRCIHTRWIPRSTALVRRGLRRLGRGPDYHCFYAAGDRAQGVVGPVLFDGLRVWVEGEPGAPRSRRRWFAMFAPCPPAFLDTAVTATRFAVRNTEAAASLEAALPTANSQQRPRFV